MKDITNLPSDGTRMGQNVSDALAFFGVTTGVSQRSASLVTTTTPTVTAFGFTSAQAGAIVTNLNLVISGLGALGLFKV